jgi:hypothetical protein
VPSGISRKQLQRRPQPFLGQYRKAERGEQIHDSQFLRLVFAETAATRCSDGAFQFTACVHGGPSWLLVEGYASSAVSLCQACGLSTGAVGRRELRDGGFGLKVAEESLG